MLHTQLNILNCFGYACGHGARDVGCEQGPDLLRSMDIIPILTSHHTSVRWKEMIRPSGFLQNKGDNYAIISELTARLADSISQTVADSHQFLVVGGDHSCAIGTWGGVYRTLGKAEPFGLIWIDAHMDSHSPTTSLSGAIHGMPLACLLGEGDERLTHIGGLGTKLSPKDVVMIGIRSFENGEKNFLQDHGVRVYYMDEVANRGFEAVFNEALRHIKSRCNKYGISLDLDAIEPDDAPGVGTPEPDGINATDLLSALNRIKGDTHLLGMEITELNPLRDVDRKTAALALKIAETVFS
ncbi:MAG: arginase [Gammaproteobacteria bacterium]|nr:arginase [Gammaproteobacteria bacterium]